MVSLKRMLKEESEEQEEDILKWIKILSSTPPFKQYRDYKVFQLRT